MEAMSAPKPVVVENSFTKTVTDYYEFTGITEAFEAVDKGVLARLTLFKI